MPVNCNTAAPSWHDPVIFSVLEVTGRPELAVGLNGMVVPAI